LSQTVISSPDKKIGINSLEDFLKFIPRIYIRKIVIRELRNHFGENVVVYGKVVDVEHPQKRNQPLKIFLNDNTGTTEIPFFGKSEFRSKQFRLNEKVVFAKMDMDKKRKEVKSKKR